MSEATVELLQDRSIELVRLLKLTERREPTVVQVAT
jgi:hypothetical protein